MNKLAVSAIAIVAAASAWAIPGTLNPSSGSSLKGNIKWMAASKKYVIEYFKWIAEENQMEIDDDYEVKSYNAGIRRIRK